MSLEILTKAVEDHGAAVKSLAGKVDGNQTKIEEALDRLQDLEMKGVKLRGGSESTSTKGAVHAFMKSSGMEITLLICRKPYTNLLSTVKKQPYAV